jgi:GNAT superfamily N-acetyltransferase
MPPIVRAAVVADAPSVGEIHVEGWRAAYRGIVPDAYLASLSAERRTEQWTGWIGAPATPDKRTWVAEDGGRVVGFAHTGRSRDADLPPGTGEVWAIYVHPASWGSGAGRALFAAATSELRAQGSPKAVLWVLEANARARRFYEREGWVPDGGSKVVSIGGAELPELRYGSGL